ncbi:MAG: HupE/UreJ family protein [Betaproteobacteria bacterium]|nr:HupE/UreJ family protein [Betaproteobacteria bacterium]
MRKFESVGRIVFVIWLVSLAGSADAHSTVKGVGDLYAGLLHVLTALEHVLPFIALSLLAGQRGMKAQAEAVLLVFPVALMIGAAAVLWVPPVPGLAFFNVASAILLGGLVAAAWPLPRAAFYGLVVLFGISHGFANGEAISGSIKAYLFILGIGLAGLAILAYGMLMVDFLLRRKAGWIPIAVRVAGSWIAAIGVLVLATTGRTMLAS